MKSIGGTSRKRGRTTSSHSNKIEESCTPFFSAEIIFLILTWVPADILYSCMRYVCKKWNEIILDPQFKEHHRPSPSSGLLFSRTNFGCRFANVGKAKAMITELALPYDYTARAGCEGLVLLEHVDDRTMHIANPLTRRITQLPQIKVHPHDYTLSFVCIRSTKEYKVVLTTYSLEQGLYECAILTLGKGCTWKLIHSPQLCGYLDKSVSTYCVGEIVFWVDDDEPHIVGLCVESEATYRLPFPKVDDHEGCEKSFFSGGESLSFAVQSERRRLVEIWCLVDPKGVADWRKMHKIDLGDTISMYNIGRSQNIPVTWVNKEVVIFRDYLLTGLICGLNVKTGKSVKIVESRLWRIPYFCCEFVCSFTWIKLR